MFPTYGQSIGLNGSNATLDLFNETLGNNNVFTLAAVGIFGLTNRFVNVQLRDTEQRPLMTITKVPGVRHSPSVTVLQMVNTSGQILLVSRNVAGLVTISSGEHILGTIDTHSHSISLTVKDHSGNILFRSVIESSSGGCFCCTPSMFTLQSDGDTLARIEQPTDNSDGCVVSLVGSSNIDLRTKALLIFSGYIVYSRYLSETECGRIGKSGLSTETEGGRIRKSGLYTRSFCIHCVLFILLCICVVIFLIYSFITSK